MYKCVPIVFVGVKGNAACVCVYDVCVLLWVSVAHALQVEFLPLPGKVTLWLDVHVRGNWEKRTSGHHPSYIRIPHTHCSLAHTHTHTHTQDYIHRHMDVSTLYVSVGLSVTAHSSIHRSTGNHLTRLFQQGAVRPH